MTPVNYDQFRERALQLRAAEFSRQLDRLLHVLTFRQSRRAPQPAGRGFNPGRPQAC
ncbi:MAG: hypothetical protein KDH20_19475 [Rhodocyclaceae bacterium]|nr:hypothetical protein [Rhodocyclaceae bacterium]